MTSTVARDELDRLVSGVHHNPHGVLGAHPTGTGSTTVRSLRPDAASVTLVVDGRSTPMDRVHDGGVFEATVKGDPSDYRLEVGYETGSFTVDDPYRWLPTLGEIDLHLVGEGRHENLWEVLGAHVRTYNTPSGSVSGTSFAVWAPNARGVRVTGEFDYWSGRALPMRSLGSSGVWEIFVPGVGDGATYKFRILGADGQWRDKADPFAFATEAPPATASVVTTPRYDWRDEAWLTRRAETQWHKAPMSIYEVHIGSWKQGLLYSELAQELVDYVKEQGFTHVEFLPVAEHPFGGSWGYQVSSYYAPSARFGSPDELALPHRRAAQRRHRRDRRLGAGALPEGRVRPRPLRRHSALRARRSAAVASSSTGAPTSSTSAAARSATSSSRTRVFWLEQFHVDGLRVDAVASMLYLDYSREEGGWEPNIYGGRENLEAVAFLQEMNATVYKRVPGVVTIAEESTSWPGVTRPTHLGRSRASGSSGTWAGCTTRWATSAHEPVHRQWHHNELTFSMMYAYTENFVMPISHDEVVHGKGSLLNKISGRPLAADWRRCARCSPTCGRTRASSCCSWARSSAQSRRVVRVPLAGLVSCTDDPGHRGLLAPDHATSTTQYSRRPTRCGRVTPPRTVFGWIDANDAARQRVLVPALRGRRRFGDRVHRELLRPSRTSSTASGCPSPVAGTRSSTPTPTSTSARGSATSAASTRSKSRGTASRRPRRCRCRRWAPCGCVTPAVRPRSRGDAV